MERKTARPGWRKFALQGAAVLLAAAVMAFALWQARRGGAPAAGLQLTTITEAQSGALQKLCRVWGFAKYYHPALAAGAVSWDQELLKLIPEILDAPAQEADARLLSWVESLGDAPEGVPPDLEAIGLREAVLELETGWMDSLSPELAGALEPLSRTYVTDRKNGPAVTEDEGYISFPNESDYAAMDPADARYRLLSLFRYWNIIQYYYPYREIPGEDWDAVLEEFIPKFLSADDRLSYKLAVAELTSHIHDSHASSWDKGGELAEFWGRNIVPASFLNIGGRIVIETSAKDCPLMPGDVVRQIDGVPAEDVIANKLKYVSLSNSERFVSVLADKLFATQKDAMNLTVEREGQILDLSVPCRPPEAGPEKPSSELLDGNIGLIHPGRLKRNEIGRIMQRFQDTDGLIVDLRQYPSDFIVFSLAEYLMPEPGSFAKFSFSAPGSPGQFNLTQNMVNGMENPEYYKGKVVLLMDERTVSQAEYTVMALRRAPGAVVAGSGSIGADGNVIQVPLPGGVRTVITGLGVFYPDGAPTQRVGLAPDAEVLPTVEGLREGRDELMEKAVELIKEG